MYDRNAKVKNYDIIKKDTKAKMKEQAMRFKNKHFNNNKSILQYLSLE